MSIFCNKAIRGKPTKKPFDKDTAEGLCSQYVEKVCSWDNPIVPENSLVRARVHRDAVRGTVLPFSSDVQRLYLRGHRALWRRPWKLVGIEADSPLSSVE